ncbi:hypothetical protein [Sporomusa termitida]|uniref:Uncharacterized protein n=1 Tax=Sporomusa termitida TaxID=2377 RepID=A0A517DYS5_9FIRM|nr:hypothetical protein [Sporomusa termitida]QDR82505.1 hypothetical protein SPTER_39330 [Sporomusa termitida]
MERKSAKRKQLSNQFRRKYKRYAAALAGAAILSGAALPGIPAAQAFAAESPSDSRVPAATYSTKDKNTKTTVKKVYGESNRHKDRNGPPGRGWHEHNHSWPGSNENQAWYQDGKIYYRGDSNYYRSDSNRYRNNANYYRSNYAYAISNPVDVVKSAAARYGFNRTTDSFTLLSRTSSRAIVEVIKSDTGQIFNMVLERTSNNDWRIVGTLAR